MNELGVEVGRPILLTSQLAGDDLIARYVSKYPELQTTAEAIVRRIYQNRLDQYRRGLRMMTLDNNAPKLDTVARYEAHIRRNIEKDFKILAGMAIAKTTGLGSSFMQSEAG